MDKEASIQQSTVERYWPQMRFGNNFENWYFQSYSRHYWKATVCIRHIAKTGENKKRSVFCPFNPFIQSLEIIRTQNIPGTEAPKCMLANFRDTTKLKGLQQSCSLRTGSSLRSINISWQLSTVLARWKVENLARDLILRLISRQVASYLQQKGTGHE